MREVPIPVEHIWQYKMLPVGVSSQCGNMTR